MEPLCDGQRCDGRLEVDPSCSKHGSPRPIDRSIDAQRIAALEQVINEVGPLMEEAIMRPLWGSLQGDWQQRARAWHDKHNETLRSVQAGIIREEQ